MLMNERKCSARVDWAHRTFRIATDQAGVVPCRATFALFHRDHLFRRNRIHRAGIFFGASVGARCPFRLTTRRSRRGRRGGFALHQFAGYVGVSRGASPAALDRHAVDGGRSPRDAGLPRAESGGGQCERLRFHDRGGAHLRADPGAVAPFAGSDDRAERRAVFLRGDARVRSCRKDAGDCRHGAHRPAGGGTGARVSDDGAGLRYRASGGPRADLGFHLRAAR